MLNRLVLRLYRRLGSRYRWMFVAVELSVTVGVASIAVVMMLSYYRPSAGQFLAIYLVVIAAVLTGVACALQRGLVHLKPALDWLHQPRGASTPEETAAAWDAATNWPLRSFRANSLRVAAIAAAPTVAFVTAELGLRWTAALVILLAALPPIAYGTVVNYALSELLMRPVVSDIAARLAEDFPFAANGLLLRKRLKLMLPIFTTFSGAVVAAVMIHHGGTKMLGESTAAAIVIGVAFSFELTVLLSRSVTGPVADLGKAVARIRSGEYDARVPVLSSDELGDLSHDFNLMAAGLAERDKMREAFATYLDRDIMPFILSGRFPDEGVEVTVSLMFVDVRGFTTFSEGASAQEVVAALNAMFELIVPIVREHGGHVDKFLGDGMLAVFGAPEGYPDHADRAVGAAVEIIRAVNTAGSPLRVGAGVDTGPVVAGSIGGGGRLNFSVIGDAVDPAARVEAATRETGDDILITVQTRAALIRPVPSHSRGCVELKGKREPVEVFAVPLDVQLNRQPQIEENVTAHG